MPYTETKVSDWLTSNGWSQYINAFTSKSYVVLEDFGDNTGDAAKAINDAIPAILPNDLSIMVTSWNKAVSADDATLPAPRETPTGPVAATLKPLPPGTSVSLDGSAIVYPDESQIPFPTTLPVPGAGVRADLSKFTADDWMLVAHYFKLLHAFDLNGVVADYLRATKVGAGQAGSGAPRSEAHRAALDWKVPAGLSFVTPNYLTIDKTTTDYSIVRRAMRNQMILDLSLDISGPFCGMAIEAQYQENQGQNATVKHLFMTASRWHPLVTLYLDDRCTIPSAGFVADVSNAVAKPTLNEQYEALSAVFDIYGHVFATEVTLGGAQFLMAESTSTLDLTDNLHKGSVNAALAGAVDGWTGKAGASVQLYNDSASSTEVLASITQEETIGYGATDEQGSSVSNWGVIGWAGLVPTTNLLEKSNESLADQVRTIWEAGRVARWGSTPPPGYADPLFYGQTVTVATPSAVIDPHKRRVIGAYPAVDTHLDVDNHGDNVRHPTIADPTLLPGADRNKLLWTFRYTGAFQKARGGGASIPLYWIISADGQFYLASTHGGPTDDRWFAVLRTPKDNWSENELDNPQAPETSSGAWTITPVDPYDKYHGALTDSYVLTNWTTNRILGPVSNPGTFNARFGLDVQAASIPAHMEDSNWLAQNSWEILPFGLISKGSR